MRFESPWALLLLLAIPALIYFRAFRRNPVAFRFSSTRHAAKAGRSWRQRFIALPMALRVAALVLLVLTLARPQQGREHVRDVSEGVAIEMVVDRSGSMREEMRFGGERLNRLEVVKRVFEEFVHGNGGDLDGRPNDLVGLVSFARYADTICPLTLGHGALSRFLETVNLAQEHEDGTSIGDAIALAAARLQTAEDAMKKQSRGAGQDYEIKSKIIILLTDGQSNRGKRQPSEAAAQAADWGIKIHTIGVGGESVSRSQGIFGAFMTAGRSTLDEGTLRRIADSTGGIYRLASDVKSLRAVYEEIDQLEKSDIESVRYLDYRELFVPFALAGLILLALEVLLSSTAFRRIP